MSRDVRKQDETIPWSLVFWILIPLVVVAVAQWGLWMLILPAVFA